MISVLDVLLVSSLLKQVSPTTTSVKEDAPLENIQKRSDSLLILNVLENVLLVSSLLKQVSPPTTSAEGDAPLESIQQRLDSLLTISAKNVLLVFTLLKRAAATLAKDALPTHTPPKKQALVASSVHRGGIQQAKSQLIALNQTQNPGSL